MMNMKNRKDVKNIDHSEVNVFFILIIKLFICIT